MSEADLNKREVQALAKVAGNDICSDCGQRDPDWVDLSFGVFICIDCSGIHRSLGSHLTKVKSISLDNFTDDNVTHLREMGNMKAKETWEAIVPICCKPPSSSDNLICREQWVRAKYERREFVQDADDTKSRPYTTGLRKGFLYKKKKVDNVWQSRFFVLDSDSLTYYKKISDQHPTESIPLLDMNVTLNGQTGHPNAMQITALVRSKTRNYYVYAENGKDIVWWFFAIRAARLKLLKLRYPGKLDGELASNMSRDFVKAGYLHKTPASKLQKFQKRYFILDQQRLMYYEKPMDAFPLGEIVIGRPEEGFSVDDSAPDDFGGENAFVFNSTTRTYPLLAETAEEKRAWVEILRRAILDASSGGLDTSYSNE